MTKISELLDDIRTQDLVLPEFQREYVWTLDQAKQLLVSLVKGYPVGGLLIWKTDRPPELKNVARLPDKMGTVQVLLDGQQRLTTLHMLLTGAIPAYYREEDILSDPRELYFNLESGEFQYYQSSRMHGDPMWRRVVDCFVDNSIDPIGIAMESGRESAIVPKLAQQLNKNLNLLRAIKDVNLPAQVVPQHAELEEAIDIFDRINSQGTKLTDAELALTHVTAKWPQARRALKEKMTFCADRDFDFNLTFMTRALVTSVTGRALYELIHPRPLGELQSGWKTLSNVLDYLMNLLPKTAHVHGTDDLSTTNALIPIIAYLARSNGVFPDQKSAQHALNWLYSALVWARYGSQTDQRLEADLSIVAKEVEPWSALRANIIEQRGRIDVKSDDFEGRTAQHPLYRMVYILMKAHGAFDWFNGVPLGKTVGTSYAIHSHHIFPQALLYRSGLDADNHVHRQMVNEIANRAFLTAVSNIPLSDTEPSAYLPTIEEKYPGALKKQFIPMDPALWRVDRYEDFLNARRELLSLKLNEYLDSLIAEPDEVKHRPIAELVKLGESSVLEFKSTLQWDVTQKQANKGLRRECLKTIAAFMNSDGGTLLIGVEDNGNVLGLSHDFSLFGGSRDRFEQTLVNIIFEAIGAAFGPYYRIRFEPIDDKLVCVVEVDPVRDGGVFVKTEKGNEFFVRQGNTTRSLDPAETHDYLKTR
ncbi:MULTISPECIES: DUF262 domain-containing protein [unclassified Bradyrhizobium]|uniref:GmrSD restriction endonuclease domain-containing protein n=1 Tax=unclassified Bradyrhizobium TaxID=2631580 RepID=UPI00247B0EE0|nr:MULTISPECIES: DUF262 domain-containing protein [unclassified Bradyrhizobium]WGS18957.1 DUF262 domain-containing protein [Bradyrhizobium sp. ISRA463]WGS25791.1 DUF262 domain-containing protein [Bradyrhizobium sp. ISRA464]